MVFLCRSAQHHEVILFHILGYRLRTPTTRRLVLVASVTYVTETATLGARDKRPKWKEMADFRNTKMVVPDFY